MKTFVFAILPLPLLVFAQETLTVGEETISYDTRTETEVGVLYHQGDILMASEHTGVTLVYENEQVVLAAYDTDADGTLDAFVAFDETEAMTGITGDGASAFEQPEVKEFSDLMAERGAGGAGAPDEDLVGPLDSITIPGQGVPVATIILWLVIIAAGYWVYKKKKDKA